jgi:hypothetical protein
VDSSSDITSLDQKLEALAQAALQNQQATLTDIMKMWTSSSSLAEKIRILQASEERRRRQAMQDQQMQLQAQQETAQAQLQAKQMELEAQIGMNSEDNETKVVVAQIQADNKLETTQMQQANSLDDGIVAPMGEAEKRKLEEQIREFNIKIQQDNKKLALEAERNDIARTAAKRKPSTSK